jgi:CubicO group peptidase (beta-lactamase class C family)
MYSMIMETDATGYFIGSSFSYASARDWAKFGQLFLQKGKWAGKEIIPQSWVDFVQQPAPNSGDDYGAHFWLNKGGNLKDVPEDAYLMDGFHGQRVFIIPSKEIVIVRLGLTYNSDDFDFNEWVSAIIGVIE